jgi:hypothetical protein
MEYILAAGGVRGSSSAAARAYWGKRIWEILSHLHHHLSLSRAAKRLNCFSHLFKLDQNYYTKADSTDSISGAPASDEKKKRSWEGDGWILHWTPRKIYRLDAWSLNQNRIEKRRAHAKI